MKELNPTSLLKMLVVHQGKVMSFLTYITLSSLKNMLHNNKEQFAPTNKNNRKNDEKLENPEAIIFSHLLALLLLSFSPLVSPIFDWLVSIQRGISNNDGCQE